MVNSGEPLGLSRGSVRSIAFLLLVGAAIAGFFLKLVPTDAFMPLVTMAATFYFVERSTGTK